MAFIFTLITTIMQPCNATLATGKKVFFGW